MINLCGRGENDGKEREMEWGMFLLNLWILRKLPGSLFPTVSPSFAGGSHITITLVPTMIGS